MSTNGTNGVDPELLRVRRESRNCRDCGGDGLTIVFHPQWAGVRVGRTWRGEMEHVEAPDGSSEYRHVMETTALEVAAHCVCALGRWMRERVDEDLRSRIPDVLAIVEGRSKWLLDPPGETEPAAKPSGFAHKAPREAIAGVVDGFRVSA